MKSTTSPTIRIKRRRLSTDERRAELLASCLDLIGNRPWDEVTMADIAAAAGVSKPLLYHYFATKPELYLATVESAADQLRTATRPDVGLPMERRMHAALEAHLDWITEHSVAYRAIVQGGISSDAAVQTIVERSRSETAARLADGLGWTPSTAAQHIALRGWIGFLEAASLDWLTTRTISKDQLADILTASIDALRNIVGVKPPNA